MGWTQALRAIGADTDLLIEVVPNAQSPAFPVGYNPWRQRIQARVGAPPEDGKANDELLRLVAAFFQVAASNVTLEDGATSRRKRLRIRGTSTAQLETRLEEALGGR